MRKYKAPGVYAHFIPTQQTITSTTPLRVLALVGTGQQCFERRNVMMTRSQNSIFDELPDKNIIEIYSVSSDPVNSRTEATNKYYTNYNLENDCIVWNQIIGNQYNPYCTIENGSGDQGFVSNIKAKIVSPKFVTTNSYKIEISSVGKMDEGTFIVTDLSTSDIIGEYTTSSEPYTDIIPGVELSVYSTFVLDKDANDSRKSKTKIGDYVIVNITSAKCHVDPLLSQIDSNYSIDADFMVENGGSYYNIVGDGKSLIDDPTAWPALQNKFVLKKAYPGINFKIELYKNGQPTTVDQVFDKFMVTVTGKVNGIDNVNKTQMLFDSSMTIGSLSEKNSIYDITSYITNSGALFNGDSFEIGYSYVLRDDDKIDLSDFIIKIRVYDATNDNAEIATLDNVIFVRNNVIPHTVSSYDKAFSGLIKDLEIIHSNRVKSALYKIKITNKEKNEIVIYDVTNGETVGTYCTDTNPEFREAIPGVSFTLYDFDEVEGLLEMYETQDIEDNTGSTIYISTLSGIINPEVPIDDTTYYVSYKYAKSEEDYDPKVYYEFDEVLENYGNYRVTSNGRVINSLTLGAELAFLNGASPIVCVQAKNDTDIEIEAAIDKLAIKIDGINNVNSIVPLTTSKAVGRYLLNHVNFYSSSNYNMPRMGYIAAEPNEQIYKLPTITNPKIGSIQAAQKYNDERIVYVVPGQVSKDIIDSVTGYTSTKTLPGCYLATAVAALAMKNDVAEPLTNKELFGFKKVLSNYNETDMNDLATAGCLVVKQEGSIIKVRHGITSHGCIDTLADIQSNEITMVQVKDFVMEGAKAKCGETYIGGKMKATILHDVQYTLEQLFNQYVADEIILGVEGLTVKRDTDDPRQINVKFFIEAIYPLNYIDISFGFSTNFQ